MKEAISTSSAPTPAGPYSQAIVAGNWIFVSGQRPTNPLTGEFAQGIALQTHQVLQNIRAVLQGGNSSMDDVVKVVAYLSDISDFEAYNKVYKEYFQDPFPARTTTGCQLRGILVEIDVIAYRQVK